MKCLILAAGYATRLYPLTENFPKPLLEVGGKAILEYFDILDTLEIEGSLERKLFNVFREDEVTESLSQEDALKNSHNPEEGYIRAPKVV